MSQVWGQSIAGPLKGTTLDLIPASIVPWGTWKAEHPDTLAMINDKTGLFVREERPRDNWVIGLAIDEHSKGYYFRALTREGVVNDSVGPFPVTLYADAETRNIHAYLRQMGDRVMTLKLDDRGENLVDPETGAAWSLARGLPQNEAAQGETLLMVPYLSSFDWAWLDFHPDSEFYE